MDRWLIVFDLDTKLLEQHYHNASWKDGQGLSQPQGDIQRILSQHQFKNIQGTVYLSEQGVNQANATLALQELAIRLPWFAKCVSNARFYGVADGFNAQFIIDSADGIAVQCAHRLVPTRMPIETVASYKDDVITWSNEQVRLIREGRLSELDLENIAEEIADVGTSEARDMVRRLAVLLGYLLQWQYPSEKNKEIGFGWLLLNIKHQRRQIAVRLKKAPTSLKAVLQDKDWIDDAWSDALALARKETGLEDTGRIVFPESCPWAIEDVLKEDWFP